MPELPERITTLIDDAAAPVDVDEIHARAGRRHRRSVVRILAAAVVIAIVGVGALAVALRPEQQHPKVVVQPTTTTVTPTPPAIGQKVGTLRIPSIGVQTEVYGGTDRVTLKRGPGLEPTSPLPGARGNVVIEGHRTTYTHPFVDLDRLHSGDRVDMDVGNTMYVYNVTGQKTVDGADLATALRKADAQLTLVTDTPKYSARQRLLVFAHLAGTLTTHIEVDATTVRTGGTVDAALVTENNTGTALELADKNGCRASFALVLGNAEHPGQVAFPNVCIAEPLVIPGGVHRFPFTLHAAASPCTSSPTPQASMPLCKAGGALPPLPAGSYFVSFADDNSHLPVPVAAAVTVTP